MSHRLTKIDTTTQRLLLADLGFLLIIGWLLLTTIDRFGYGQSELLLPYLNTEDLGQVIPADSVLSVRIGKPGVIIIDSATLFPTQVADLIIAYVAKYGRTPNRAVSILVDSSSNYTNYIQVLDACKLARRILANRIADEYGIYDYSRSSQTADKAVVEREIRILFMEYTAVLDTVSGKEVQRILPLCGMNDWSY